MVPEAGAPDGALGTVMADAGFTTMSRSGTRVSIVSAGA
jgi:hypothetical protein